MSTRSFMGTALVLTATLAAGCSEGTDDRYLSTGLLRLPYNAENGEKPNGYKSNGYKSNGYKSNGYKSNGIDANRTISNVEVHASETETPKLKGFLVDESRPMYGSEFKGATIRARYTNGIEDEVMVEDYDGTTVPGTDLYLVRSKSDNEPLCGYDALNQPVWASVLPQVFDPNSGAEAPDDPQLFTFACRFAALEKCNEYGYPKTKAKNEFNGSSRRKRKMVDYHAACVRMVRADYCGNGVHHTFNGTSIDIIDHLEGGNEPATTPGVGGWEFEAGWEDDGAHCINKTRWMPSSLTTLAQNQTSANPDWEYIRVNCPNRFAFPVQKTDGTMSVPDRACGAASNFYTNQGFTLYATDSARQQSRTLLTNHSMTGNRY